MTDDQPKRGRPSDYSFRVVISICAWLAEGKSLRAICSEAGMPGRATVFRWIARHKEFRDEYTLACELRAEDLADEMMEIVDDPCVWVETVHEFKIGIVSRVTPAPEPSPNRFEKRVGLRHAAVVRNRQCRRLGGGFAR